MGLRTRRSAAALAVAVLVAAGALAQRSGVDVRVIAPADGRINLLDTDCGIASELLTCRLAWRNAGGAAFRGIAIAAHPAGGNSAVVTLPFVRPEPGEAFETKFELAVVDARPADGPPSIEIAVDGLLDSRMRFAGENRFDSRRALTAWELEARGDRRRLLDLLENGGSQALAAELQRISAQRRATVDVRTEPAAAPDSAGQVHIPVRLANTPEAPLELIEGSAERNGAALAAPAVRARNRSDSAIRTFEIGWLVEDAAGAARFAGTAASVRGPLQPGAAASSQASKAYRLQTGPGGSTISVERVTVFVRSVEFMDGGVWVPERHDLSRQGIPGEETASLEAHRLAKLLERRGIEAVIADLENAAAADSRQAP